jgi:hypothetical protein
VETRIWRRAERVRRPGTEIGQRRGRPAVVGAGNCFGDDVHPWVSARSPIRAPSPSLTSPFRAPEIKKCNNQESGV